MKKIIVKKDMLTERLNGVEENKVKLPQHIVKQLRLHKTSLGNHPAFPPEDEDCFDYKITCNRFKKLYDELSKFDDIGELTETNLSNMLSKLVRECKEIEKPIKENLEMLCGNIVNILFNIPQDAVAFKCELVDSVDNSDKRLTPEKTDDIELDGVDSLEQLSKEVYKRRMINSIIQGMSLDYSSEIQLYIKGIYELNYKLPMLYEKIIKINDFLLFLKSDISNDESKTDAGSVDVRLGNDVQQSTIDAKGIIFPIMLNESIKGFLELFAAHGLPEKKDDAIYVMKKADFLLAEPWDMMLGKSIWGILNECIMQVSDDPLNIGLPFIFTEIASLPVDDFHGFMREVLAKTKKGKQLMKSMIDYILHEKNKDDFDEYLNNKNSDVSIIEDSEYFLPEELDVNY